MSLEYYYRQLLDEKKTLRLEIKKSEEEKVYLSQNSEEKFTNNSENLHRDIKGLEENIVKFKLLKAQMQEKLETVKDSLFLWKENLSKKEKKIKNLQVDLERYTEYRNLIQRSITKFKNSANMSTNSSTSPNFSCTSDPDNNISAANIFFTSRS